MSSTFLISLNFIYHWNIMCLMAVFNGLIQWEEKCSSCYTLKSRRRCCYDSFDPKASKKVDIRISSWNFIICNYWFTLYSSSLNGCIFWLFIRTTMVWVTMFIEMWKNIYITWYFAIIARACIDYIWISIYVFVYYANSSQ